MSLLGDVFGLIGDLGKYAARRNIGWPRESCDSCEAFHVAIMAFERYDRNRTEAIRLMNECEIRTYDELLRKYPGGYAEYRKKMDEMREQEKARKEARYKADPVGAWCEDVRNEMETRRSEAEWDMAVDSQRGIYRPKSDYGL